MVLVVGVVGLKVWKVVLVDCLITWLVIRYNRTCKKWHKALHYTNIVTVDSSPSMVTLQTVNKCREGHPLSNSDLTSVSDIRK